MKLLSKLQFNNFETGEFTEASERSYDETIARIETFPWQTQRRKIVIDLTNPSITIEGTTCNYLKLATYFNNKFVIHYTDVTDKLYKKSVTKIEEAYPFIYAFFKDPSKVTDGLKKEDTMFKKNLPHFQSKDFRYQLSNASSKRFFFKSSAFNLIAGAVMLFAMISNTQQAQMISWIVTLIFMFFVGGGWNLLLFWQHNQYAKGLMFIMTKGNDEFFFGSKDRLKRYHKSDITQVEIRKKEGKHFVAEFAVVTLVMRNSVNIDIPNMLVEEMELLNKLPGIRQKRISEVPYM